MNVIDKCKELVKLAKSSEKENRVDSLELYKQAAECFAENNNTKEKNSNMEKAAELLKEIAKLSESPIIAFDYYEQSAILYTEIENEKETANVMQDAHQNFLNVAMKIRSETKKINDIDLAEQRLKLASEYAIRGKDEKLSSDCWIDLGDQIRQEAMNIEDPREAHEVFARAIANYQKGHVETKEFVTLKYIAEKYHKKANEIITSKKQFAHALDNYNQASIFYGKIKSDDKVKSCDKRIQEICELIGIPKKIILDFLEGNRKNIISLPETKIPIKERKIPIRKTSAPMEEIDDTSQNLVSGYFEELKKREDMIKTHVPKPSEEKQISVQIADEKSSKELMQTVSEKVKLDEIIKIEDVSRASEQLDDKKSIPDLMNDLDSKIKSSEVIKKRIKKEIQQGKPKVKKEKRGEKKKTKEINKLFDKALDGIKEDIEHRLEDITVIDKSEERPKFTEPVVDTITQESDHIPKPEIINNTEIIEEKSKIIDPVTDVVKEFNNFKPELTHFTESTKSKEKVKVRDPVIDRLKIEDNIKPDIKSNLDLAKSEKREKIGPAIIDILRKQGYIDKKFPTEEDLLKVPEYEILMHIIKQHPIPLEELEKKSQLDSISLVLSNLQADDLIVQTNDYQWTISEKVEHNLEKPKHEPITQEVSLDEIQTLRSRIERNSTLEHKLISTMHNFGLIPDRDKSLTSLMKIPEFAIIKTIKDNEPVELTLIKEEVFNIPPVQVTRILSRLELDGRIAQNKDGLWELSDNFVKELVMN